MAVFDDFMRFIVLRGINKKQDLPASPLTEAWSCFLLANQRF